LKDTDSRRNKTPNSDSAAKNLQKTSQPRHKKIFVAYWMRKNQTQSSH